MTRDTDELIRQSRATLQNPWAHLSGEGVYDALLPQKAVARAVIHPNDLLGGLTKGRRFSRTEIETIVRNLHRLMWQNRRQICGTEDVQPSKLLDPELALEVIGYKVKMHDSLGQHVGGRDSFEVAGIMDKDRNEVRISRRFAPALRNFTAAHELGHAILHEGTGLHRDRAPDGSAAGARDSEEVEADTFAALFLLPEKQVRLAFERRFLTRSFRMTEAAAFALSGASLRDLQRRCKNDRDLARILAGAQRYNGRHFQSLAEWFGVSVEVMAIRLEELCLVRLRG